MTTRFLRATESSFAKIFIDPLETKATVSGGRASVDYFICALPQGLIRRTCVRQKAALVRQGIRWKISSFEVRMNTQHEFNYERQEGLITPNSTMKYPVRQHAPGKKAPPAPAQKTE